MSVQVKAILHRGPNEEELPRKEIRRFEIEASAAGSYEFLRAKIVALYPDLTADSPFRLMWTDDEGDNVCFSTDEEYAQALKFVATQETRLFKVMVKMPAVFGGAKQQPNKQTEKPMEFTETAANFAQQASDFGQAFCASFNPKQMAKKCEKMKAKQQFHESKAKQLNEMLRSINPQMHHHIHSVAQQMAQMNQGDSVDIPINHSSSSSSTTTTSTTTPTGTTTTTNVYPELNKTGEQQMEEDFTPVSTEDANQAKLTEAVKKMAELGFEGEWVEPLLKSVDCDIARAVDKLTPVVKK